MTSYRFHYRPSGIEGSNYGKLFIRVIHGRKYKDIQSEYMINADEWDAVQKDVKLPDVNSERRYQLLEIKASMKEDIKRLDEIVDLLSKSGEYSVWDIHSKYEELHTSNTLLSFSKALAKELRANDQSRTARAYRSAAKSIVDYNGGMDIALSDIRSSLIRAYEQHLLERGLQMNTVAFYMRNLRAIYYRAIKSGIILRQEVNPFEKVFTGVYATRRRALNSGDINSLAKLEKSLAMRLEVLKAEAATQEREYTVTQRQRESILYFMFSYHARGMSFIDLAYLRKSDIQSDSFKYKRKKTGMYMQVRITKQMKKIINYFKKQTKDSVYVFPIITSRGDGHRLDYENGLTTQNRRLKEVRGLAGIKKNLSTHVARHTWATTAKRLGYDVSLISEGLGHRDTKVTSIYLDSFERSAMDEISIRLSNAVAA